MCTSLAFETAIIYDPLGDGEMIGDQHQMKQEGWPTKEKEEEEEEEEERKGAEVKKEMGTTVEGTSAELTQQQQTQITADQTDIYRELILRHLIADISGTCTKLGLSTDLAAWSGDDCRRWVGEMCAQFQLSFPEEGAFTMDGRRLLALSVEEFQERFPDGGDTLHAQLQLWKTAFESCGHPIGGGGGPNGGAQPRPIGISMEEQNANCWLSPTPNSSDFVCPSSACSPIASSSSSTHQQHFQHVTAQQHFYNSNASSTALFAPNANAIRTHHNQPQSQQLFRHHSQVRCADSSLYSPPDDLSSVADDEFVCCSSSSASSSSASSSSADVPSLRLHHPQNPSFFATCPQNLLNCSNGIQQHNNGHHHQQQSQGVVPFCHFAEQQQPTMAQHFQSQQQNQQQFQHHHHHPQQQQQQQQQIRRVHQQQSATAAFAALHQTQQMQPQRTVCGHGNGGTIHLWHFIRELLDQPRDYGGCVRWVDRKEGTFKIESSHHLARFWGLRKNRAAMNYDKLSRSLRQYYKKGIIQKPEKKQRLVYKFLPPYNQ
ncbi:hypothetical protein niasHS_002751 [Heterodera schachtii]|uniref:DNA-binding protein D-ETS-4 n=1 Tax=Heterodera schachtii TaxID=97005 RepID=A0ABD2K2C3_HETSC